MALIKEITHGQCKIYVHDDYIVKTQEEIQQIVDNVSRIVINEERRKAVAAQEAKEKGECG